MLTTQPVSITTIKFATKDCAVRPLGQYSPRRAAGAEGSHLWQRTEPWVQDLGESRTAGVEPSTAISRLVFQQPPTQSCTWVCNPLPNILIKLSHWFTVSHGRVDRAEVSDFCLRLITCSGLKQRNRFHRELFLSLFSYQNTEVISAEFLGDLTLIKKAAVKSLKVFAVQNVLKAHNSNVICKHRVLVQRKDRPPHSGSPLHKAAFSQQSVTTQSKIDLHWCKL